MKFTLEYGREFAVGGIKGVEYSTKKDFPNASVAFMVVSGRHGKNKNMKSDRVYIIKAGSGKFVIDEKGTEVGKNDVIIIPKGTPYDFMGEMQLFLVDTPAFEKDADMPLE